MRRLFVLAVAILLAISLSGCLKTTENLQTQAVLQNPYAINTASTLNNNNAKQQTVTPPRASAFARVVPASNRCLTPEARKGWRNDTGGFTPIWKDPGKSVADLVENMVSDALAGAVVGGFGLGQLFQLATQVDRSLNSMVGLKVKNSMPVCGNWCGSGHPAPNENPGVVDELDAVCRWHDICYRKFGRYNCKCDEVFVKAIRHGRPTIRLSATEMKIVLLFMGSPCYGGCKKFKTNQVCGKIGR